MLSRWNCSSASVEPEVNLTEANEVLNAVEGATIVSGYVEDDSGLHFVLADGRILVIVGFFAIGLMRVVDPERMH